MNADQPKVTESTYQANADELAREYARRFAKTAAYRQEVWKILVKNYFQQFVPERASVLDLGCGYGDFINAVQASQKHGMDLNPDSRAKLAPDVQFHFHDATQPWPIAEASLDAVFTSNFLEHMPSKNHVKQILEQAWRCLKPNGVFLALGPNIKYLAGEYWDFWDHHVALTEDSLSEALELNGYEVTLKVPRFLPYRINPNRQMPLLFVKLYLMLPIAWSWFGKQFFVVGRRLV